MAREIVYWDVEYEEHLSHTDEYDAIVSHLEGFDLDSFPDKIELCGFSRMEPKPESFVDHVLEHLVEALDENYCDPDGGSTDPTVKMKAAAKVFVAAVLDEYTPWACEIVKRKTINVNEWVKENPEVKEE